MGKFRLAGTPAIERFDGLVCCNTVGLAPGRCRYGAMLDESGGIVDDIVVMKAAPEELYVITNAAPFEKVSARIRLEVPGVEDLTDSTAKIDIQGPLSREVLLELGMTELRKLRYFSVCRTEWQGLDLIVSRAGFTGELGYELFLPAASAPLLWRELLRRDEVAPAGLGARDTLRLEIGYLLSGQDVDESHTALEAGLNQFIEWDRPFRGREALAAQRARGDYPRLVGLRTLDRRAPRRSFEVCNNGAVVGHITSGTYGPSVGCGIGLAYMPAHLPSAGTPLTVGPKKVSAETVERPFYKFGTCRV
jgi:aminomethyltransferase